MAASVVAGSGAATMSPALGHHPRPPLTVAAFACPQLRPVVALRPMPALRRGSAQGRRVTASGAVARGLPSAGVGVDLGSWHGHQHSVLTAVSALTAGQELHPAGKSPHWMVNAKKGPSSRTALTLSARSSSSQSGTETSEAPTDTGTETSTASEPPVDTEASTDSEPPIDTETSTDSEPPLTPSGTEASTDSEPPIDTEASTDSEPPLTPTDTEAPSSPATDSALSASDSTTDVTEEQSPAPEAPPLPHILGADYTVLGFIAAGPLLARAGITFSEVEDNLSQWVELGGVLAKQLGFDVAGNLSDSEQRRIFHYYLPVFFWCTRQLAVHREQQGSGPSRPLVVGISAPQGCGKTTVTESLEYLFGYSGLNTAGISLDDFYLTYAEQTQLAADNPGNKLLELRGNAGSHDLQLAEATLEALLKATTPEVTVSLPRYEKSAYSGRGDRAPKESWPVAKGPVAVVLLEGWMLGFEPLLDSEAAAVNPDLVAVNQRLGAYKTLHDAVDSWVVIQVKDVDCVFQWRLEAEVRMRSTGKPGMTDEQVADFVSRYMPAYKAYLAKLYSETPGSSSPDNTLRISVDRQRNPIA